MSNLNHEPTVFEIEKWVRNIFQDTDIDIPLLEGKYECMKLLSSIISINKEAEKEVEEIIKTESYLADLFSKKSDEISSSFCQTILAKDLQSDVSENVKRIALIAKHMKLKEPTLTNFLLCSTDLDNKKESYIEQEMINAFTLSKFSKKITDVMQKNVILEGDIEMLEKKVSKKQTVNLELNKKLKFFKIKGDEYKKRIKRSEKQLKSLGWNTSLSHNELVKRSECIQSLEHKVKNLATKLESYQNLPPNEMLTRFKIEEAQAEILRLQKEFDNLLKVIC